MADLATPSAATVSTINAGADPAPEDKKKEKVEKPEKPDEAEFKEKLSKAEKEHGGIMEKMNAIRAKIDLASPKSSSSPAKQRQQDLRGQLSAIRQQQQGLKTSKGSVQEKIRQLDTTLKARIAEQNNARSRVQYKNVDEVDREIQRLEKQVDTGTMKLVDEKKALADISSLRKQRKGFAGFDEARKGIDDVKAQISDLRKGLDDPESKALSEKYTAIAKELDEIRAEQDVAYKGINSLRDERAKLQTEQQEKYTAMRALKDQHYAAKRAYADYENEAYRIRREKQRTEREGYEKDRRRKVADKKLEEASEPAYMDEILTAEGLIRYFDPSAIGSASKSAEPGKFAAQASRTVDEAGLKGTKVVRKEEESYFAGTGGKKGKKGRKGGAPAAAASPASTPSEAPAAAGGKFNLSIGVIEELGKVHVEPPMSQAEVPAVVEKLKSKLATWKENQAKQTKENVAKAEKEIERLEAEAKEPAPAAASSSQSGKSGRSKDAKKTDAKTNGSGEGAKQNGDAAATDKVADDLKAAKIEDKE